MFKKMRFIKSIWPVAALVFFPTLALADTGSDDITPILNGLIQLLSTGIARTVFVLAIVGIGYGWLHMGRIPKEKAIAAIIGIGIVFSASWLAQQMGVGGN